MPSWRRKAPVGESDWAFKDYLKIENEGKIKELFKKYEVGVVLWPKGDGRITEPLIDLSETPWLKKFIGGRERKKLADELEKQGWKKVYEDDTAVVYLEGG
jgi:hypothetical protein